MKVQCADHENCMGINMAVQYNCGVAIATYNGENFIAEQLNSILNQTVKPDLIVVSDGGSDDNTVAVCEDILSGSGVAYKLLTSDGRLSIKDNFEKCISFCEADYIFISDQDDVWFSNKLIRCIKKIQDCPSDDVIMVHHNRCRCSVDLAPLPDTAKRLELPLNLKNALIQEYAQGCTMVFNKAAWRLIKRFEPKSNIPHDLWVGMLCYYFGKVFFVDEPLIYHIQYGTNASTTGNVLAGRLKRLKMFLDRAVYVNPADDLLCGFGELIQDQQFLLDLKNYKKSLAKRLKIFFDREFVRSNLMGTISLKMAVLLGKI